MPRATRSTQLVRKTGKSPGKSSKATVANVNKPTRAAITSAAIASPNKRSAIKSKNENPIASVSTKSTMDVQEIPNNGEKKRKSADELRSKGRSRPATEHELPEGSFKIQEKYKSSNVPKITIRGNQAYIDGWDSPIDRNLVQANIENGDQVLQLH